MVLAARAVVAAFGLLLVLAPPAGAQTYPPSTNSWVYDFADAISAGDEAEITALFRTLEAETAVDAVAVAINSVGDYQPGVPLEEFAKGLFNHWQLGDAGIDDGVLLVVAVRDRQARVTIGDGFADRFVAEAQVVIDSMLPSFRAGDYSGGIKTGAREIAGRFRSLDGSAGADDESDSSRSPTGGGSSDMFEAASGEESSGGRGGIPSGVWYAVGSGGAALFGAGGFVTWQRIKPRRCQQCSREMKRLRGRAAEQPHLQAGQNVEEQLDSVEYDVFECVSCGAHKVERHGKLFSGKKCQQCSYRTLTTSRRTIRMATYDHGGLDRITKDCQQCGYHHEYEVSTPKKTRPSSRTGWRSGGGSSGPSGGGRSSGRGASGSW